MRAAVLRSHAVKVGGAEGWEGQAVSGGDSLEDRCFDRATAGEQQDVGGLGGRILPGLSLEGDLQRFV